MIKHFYLHAFYLLFLFDFYLFRCQKVTTGKQLAQPYLDMSDAKFLNQEEDGRFLSVSKTEFRTLIQSNELSEFDKLDHWLGIDRGRILMRGPIRFIYLNWRIRIETSFHFEFYLKAPRSKSGLSPHQVRIQIKASAGVCE